MSEVKKQSIGSLFGVDHAKEIDGIVIQYGENLKVRISRAGPSNPRFVKVAEEKTRPFRRMAEQGSLPPEIDKRIAREIFAEAIVLEWSGAFDDDQEPVITGDGNEIPFSKENVVKAFEKWPEFFDFVAEEAKRMANFRKSELKDQSKN